MRSVLPVYVFSICILSFVSIVQAESEIPDVPNGFVCKSDEASTRDNLDIDPACLDGLCPARSIKFEIDFDGAPLWGTECHRGKADGQTAAAKEKAIKNMLKDAETDRDTDIDDDGKPDFDIDKLCTGTCANGKKCMITGIKLSGDGNVGEPSYDTSGGDTEVEICAAYGGTKTYYVICGCVKPEGKAKFPSCESSVVQSEDKPLESIVKSKDFIFAN